MSEDTELVREIAEESAVESKLRKYVVVQITASTWDKLQSRYAALMARGRVHLGSENK